jgi:hypothetical protein
LHTLHLHNLLLLGVSPCEVLVLVASLPTSPSSLKTDFICISYCVFGFGGFTGSFLWEVLTSPYLIFYLLIILGLCVVHWIDIFLSFSKSLSLLKSESGCESYRIFREDIFCRFQTRLDQKFNQNFNRKSTEKLHNCFLVFPVLGPVGPSFGPGITRTSGK